MERSDFIKLISLYAALFSIAHLLIEKFTPRHQENFWFLVSLGIIFRLIFSVAIPNLSQDFYRFLWDGRLLIQGVSPYLFTPEIHLQELEIANENNLRNLTFEVPQARQLFEGMGGLNASHFSNYPPMNQFLFAIAALFAGNNILGSVIVLRIIIILADLGILYFGKKLLVLLSLPQRNIFLYFLNPFIIIELTGNLHFEGVMLFFFVWALYLLFKGKWLWAAVLIGISVSVKLIPLVFLPLIIKHFIKSPKTSQVLEPCEVDPKIKNYNWITLLKFYLVIGITIVITFLPFLSAEFIHNFSATIGLWFQNFEFNASVYYVVRWIGFQIVGWNVIATAGKILPIITFLSVLGIAFFRKNRAPQQLVISMVFAISIYFLFSTTVHPWYIATPLLLSVFTKYKFPIVWSLMIMLSYSAYGKDGFDEKLWLVSLEYIIVIGYALWEIILQKKIKPASF